MSEPHQVEQIYCYPGHLLKNVATIDVAKFGHPHIDHFYDLLASVLSDLID